MADDTSPTRGFLTWALATTGVTLAAWWFQSRSRESEAEERTRSRLRAWEYR